MSELFTLFERSSDAAFAIDERQRIIFWNETAANLTGCRVETTLGQPCWQILQGKSKEGAPLCCANCSLIRQTKAGKIVHDVDMAIQSCSEVALLVNLSTLPVSSESWNGHQPLLVHLMRPLCQPENQFGALRIYLLGPLRAQRPDGSFVRGGFWQTAQVRALLVLLAEADHAPIPEQTLAAALWPRLPEGERVGALATAVAHLRLSLEPELETPDQSTYIWQTDQGYQINPAIPLWNDLDHVADQMERIRLEPNLQRANTMLEALLTHFRGDYLADLRETAVWSIRRHQRAQELHLDGLETAGDCWRQLDQPQEAKKLYLSALILDPNRDTAYQKLLHLALPHSSKTETLRTCQRLTASLRRELDFMLGEAFRDLLKETENTSVLGR